MKLEDLQRILDVSPAHSVIVDVCEVLDAPGTLRTLTIHRESDVTIEFERCVDYVQQLHEGSGLKYVGSYPNLDDLVLDLERYLERPLANWANFSDEPYRPTVMVEPDPAANLLYFEQLVRLKRTKLPLNADFEIAGIYWRHIELFGEYRPDRLGEETELALKKYGL